MGRRIEIELTSTREDGMWTWRAAGAREPKGTVEADLLPGAAKVGDVVRAELEGFIDGMRVVNVLPPKTKADRNEPQRLELITSSSDEPLVTTTRVKGRRDDRRDDRGGGRRGRSRDRNERGEGRDRDRDRSRPDGRRSRSDQDRGRGERTGPRRSGPPEDAKPKPKRLRPGKAHRTALLESLKTEERPIAEQLLQGGIPAVRQAIKKQNDQLRDEKKPEVNADALMAVAERLRPKAQAALWRDRAEAALKTVDDLDLRDLRSVVNAAGDAGRDKEARELAEQLREALAARVESEQAAWVAEVADNLANERVVRALRLSSRPPKAGSPLPGELTQQLIAATTAALTSETGQQRWATVLDALAYSPIRRRVVPESLPEKLTPDLRDTVARLASRLPEIAHIFDISPEDAPAKPARQPKRKPQGRKGSGQGKGGPRGGADAGKGQAKGGDVAADKPEGSGGDAAADAAAEETLDTAGQAADAGGEATAAGDAAPSVAADGDEAPEADPSEAKADTSKPDTAPADREGDAASPDDAPAQPASVS